MMAPKTALTPPLYHRLQHFLLTTLPKLHLPVPPFLKTILTILLSWRTLFFLLALTNLKALPFSWHIRLLINMARYGQHPHQIRRRLLRAANALPPPSPNHPKPLHPIFRPVTYQTHAPLFECDYNMHKSNSTYFSDLDHSRGNLVASLIGPALRLNVLVPHGIRPGLCYPILGSVHTSFLREIKPYEKYGVRSRVIGWDRKWLVIGSWFVRKATRAEVHRDKSSGKNMLKGALGEEEVVFAFVLNKYVVKAGRVTVPPELCLAGSGWFPVRPEATATIRAYNSNGGGAGQTGTGTGTASPALGPQKVVDDASNAVHSVALEAGRRLSMSGEKKGRIQQLLGQERKESSDDSSAVSGSGNDKDWPGWSWDDIEEERARGMKVVERWMGIDTKLRVEYEEDMAREIW